MIMAIKITIGVIVVAIISAWAFYIDNRRNSAEDDMTETEKEA